MTTPPKKVLGVSWIMSGIVILFMLMDSIMKLIQANEAITATVELGYSAHHILPIGILGFFSILLYTYPKTTILGVLLLTAYWGGAIATHVRLDNPLLSHILFPVYLGVLAWGGIWLRDERLKKLLPIRKSC